MSIFGNLLSKIFPSDHPAVAAGQQTASASTNTATMPQVDVETVLNGMASKNPEKLNWRTSVVDLMKLVGMDSSLAARKTLAEELKYTGDTNDSATMNVWLQKQVMNKIAANGGKLPQDLAHTAA